MGNSGEREALFVIDLQAGFFESEPLAERKDEIVARINRLIRAAREAGVPVFLISTVHSRDRSTWTLNMLDDGQGYLFSGDPTTEIVEGVDEEGVTRVEKTRDSAWFGTDLHLRLKNLEVNRVLLAGVSTHLCIAHTARDGYAMNIRVTIVSDAVASERPDYEEVVLAQIVDDRQAELVSSDDIICRWRASQRS